jgi:multicomponent Na+:H+ antiporter subunit E
VQDCRGKWRGSLFKGFTKLSSFLYENKVKTSRRLHFLRNTLIEAFLLMAFWLLLSGHYDRMHISFGVFSVFLVILINYPLRKNLYTLEEKSESQRLSILKLMIYIPWLLWQIIIASLQVAYVVLHPRCPIDPSLVRFKTGLQNTSAKVILGNSITLTPGTITLQIEQDEFLVHSLMDVSCSGIIDGTLPGQVDNLFEKNPGKVVKDVKIIRT